MLSALIGSASKCTLVWGNDITAASNKCRAMIYQNLLVRGPYDISAQGTSLPFIYFICSEEHGGDVVVDDEQELYVNSIKLLVFGQRRQASLDVVADNEH